MRFDSNSIEKQLEGLEAKRDRALPSSQKELILAQEEANRISLLNALQTARLGEAVVSLTELLQRALKANVKVLEGIQKELSSFGFAPFSDKVEVGELRLAESGNEGSTF